MALVLVVDDAQFMRMRLKKLLTDGGPPSGGSRQRLRGAGAVRNAQTRRGLHGHHDAGHGRTDGAQGDEEAHPDAKVVMCSALGQQSAVLEAIKSGASDLSSSPLSPSGFCKRWESW